jgi:hypothetical protein
MKLRLVGVASGFVIALIGAGGAWAHQTATNNGVTVTLHVAPDDEPAATQPAFIVVESVKTRTGRFAWATCRCTVEISNSAREVLRRGPAGRRTVFTFPEAGAYRINVAGRVKRKAGWRSFKVSFAIRADAPS